MMKQIQKMLSLMSLKFAPFSAKELNGNKTGYLYSRKGKIECQFDFYYIEHGIVYSINYLYFNDRHHRDSLKRIVSITNLKEMSSPKEYFVLTRHFKLQPDYDTYRDVVKAWIENNDLLFYEDINVDDLPNSLSDDFTKISEDITAETYSILEGAEPVAEGSLYADLFVINERAIVMEATMNKEMIQKTEAFLKDTFAASTYLQTHPTDRDYRLEHSYRVANIAKTIAEAEGFHVPHAVIAGLLHDISYCEEMVTREDRLNHGRRSAAIARPFLESLGLADDAVNEICYGIAIHVDDESDFEWERSPFCETVGDADNIDRFDVYRIYESLQWMQFSEMPLEQKKSQVDSIIEKLTKYKDMKLGTTTAKELWIQRLDYQLDFYARLKAQLENSTTIK